MTINRIPNTQDKPAKLPKPCVYCGTIGHSAFQCHKKPKRALQPKSKLVAKKRMKPLGKQGLKWIETRNLWFSLHPAERYDCYICSVSMAKSETTLDHIQSRGRHPELRYVLSNLAPCCGPCNEAKGSLSIEEYKRKLKNGKN